jgi:hypothetical protein
VAKDLSHHTPGPSSARSTASGLASARPPALPSPPSADRSGAMPAHARTATGPLTPLSPVSGDRSGSMPALARTGTGPQPALPGTPRVLPLDPALVAITAAETRHEVLDALVAYLRHRFTVGVVFVVKGNLAIAQAGFGGDVPPEAFAAIMVPLYEPSVLRRAHDRGDLFVGAPTDTSLVQERFFKLFGPPPGLVVVAPVMIKGRPINLLYGHGPRHVTGDSAAAELRTVAAAAEEAFVRIILESNGG